MDTASPSGDRDPGRPSTPRRRMGANERRGASHRRAARYPARQNGPATRTVRECGPRPASACRAANDRDRRRVARALGCARVCAPANCAGCNAQQCGSQVRCSGKVCNDGSKRCARGDRPTTGCASARRRRGRSRARTIRSGGRRGRSDGRAGGGAANCRVRAAVRRARSRRERRRAEAARGSRRAKPRGALLHGRGRARLAGAVRLAVGTAECVAGPDRSAHRRTGGKARGARAVGIAPARTAGAARRELHLDHCQDAAGRRRRATRRHGRDDRVPRSRKARSTQCKHDPERNGPAEGGATCRQYDRTSECTRKAVAHGARLQALQ